MQFDYVIVGAIPPVASLQPLSENPNTRVCLLEAALRTTACLFVPAGIIWLMRPTPATGVITRTAALNNREIYIPGARPGRLSAVNAMRYTCHRLRPLNRSAPGYKDVLPLFKRCETTSPAAKTVPRRQRQPEHFRAEIPPPGQRGLRDRRRTGRHPATDDFNNDTQEGMSMYKNQKDGERWAWPVAICTRPWNATT